MTYGKMLLSHGIIPQKLEKLFRKTLISNQLGVSVSRSENFA